ncbi:MAG: IS66 family insertion sequence element accessory protein TnpB, partial [Gammaproteobacteria bacterium]|nr:IS66 family insertion sequence element accessory protein TnpB [Gammaproteobacteria bacterium]
MGYSLRPALDMTDIYLYREPVDFRKQSNGLAAIVEGELGHNPFSGGLYVFTNRQRNRINKRVFDLVMRFGTSKSPKRTRSSTTY